MGSRKMHMIYYVGEAKQRNLGFYSCNSLLICYNMNRKEDVYKRP